jgi:hypothetical protein
MTPQSPRPTFIYRTSNLKVILILLLANPLAQNCVPVTIAAKIPSRERHGFEAGQYEAPVSQVAVPLHTRISPSNLNAGASLSSGDAIGNTGSSSVPLPRKASRVPRVAALIARFSRPKKTLLIAVEENDHAKLDELLNDQIKAAWIDSATLDKALRIAVNKGQEQSDRLLLDNGASANALFKGYTVLHLAFILGDEHIIRLLDDSKPQPEAEGRKEAAVNPNPVK